MSTVFETYVLPISGIDFVKYIAFYSLLSEYSLKPKVIYSASGGCLVSYMALMSGFTKSIESWNISSEMFIDKLSPFSSRIFTFALNGFFYHRPDIKSYIEKLFIPAKLRKVEIISGYHESATGINVVNTNFPEKSSILSGMKIPVVGPSTRIDYLEDDVEQIHETVQRIEKTTNIPFLLAPCGAAKAIDFGIIAPSPRALTSANMGKSIYFSPVDLDNTSHANKYETLFHNMIVQDIIQVRSIFNFENSFSSLEQVIDFVKSKEKYCLVIYCTLRVALQLESFNSAGVYQCVQNCKKSVKFRVFHT